ncbi:hypothetical protein JTE90_011353 [Oedothorax gibbosus]|uniref:Uncharacterized protein n=1 Tax=Oedothorax gibbosus TaxID=931172 RepID=A0AAV6VMC8_9ARAC|nr:hypothetical protein JTE90_011353 [Oedothorax gibbosus]
MVFFFSFSFACLNNKLSRTSGLPGNQAADVSNGVRNSPPPPIQAEVQEPPKPMLPTVVANTPPVSVTPPLVAAETNRYSIRRRSCQTSNCTGFFVPLPLPSTVE